MVPLENYFLSSMQVVSTAKLVQKPTRYSVEVHLKKTQIIKVSNRLELELSKAFDALLGLVTKRSCKSTVEVARECGRILC